MADYSSNPTNKWSIVSSVILITIGAAITYLLLRGGGAAQTVGLDIRRQSPELSNWKPLDKIPSLDDLKIEKIEIQIPQYMEQRNTITEQLGQMTQKIDELTHIVQTKLSNPVTQDQTPIPMKLDYKIETSTPIVKIGKADSFPTPVIHTQIEHPTPTVYTSSPSPIVQSQRTYKNNEKWKIIRNKKGYIESIEVVRDAKINDDKK